MEELENEFPDDEITKILLGENEYTIHKAKQDSQQAAQQSIARAIRARQARQQAAQQAAALAQQQAAQPGGN